MLDQTRPLINRRLHVRRPASIKALMLRGEQKSLPCMLTDISDVGARIRVENVEDVPERFTIVMTEQGVPRRDCRLVWRGDGDIGVEFEGA